MATPSHPADLSSLDKLSQTLLERARELPEGSYTTKLMLGGVPKIAGKVREEAEEMIEAAEALSPDKAVSEIDPSDKDRQHLIYEAGDLIYHTLVMLAHRGVGIQEVVAELARREGTSGLVEKANRPPKT
ncbi:MAG: phosphoribosyl-ATP diphosphatase [Planctomycetota bacterium]